MATAHDIVLTFEANGVNVQQEVMDCTDVAAAFCTAKSTGGETFFNVRQDCYLTDIVATAAAADTTLKKLYINGKDVGISFAVAQTAATVQNRIAKPIGPIKAGSMIQIEQVA